MKYLKEFLNLWLLWSFHQLVQKYHKSLMFSWKILKDLSVSESILKSLPIVKKYLRQNLIFWSNMLNVFPVPDEIPGKPLQFWFHTQNV